jgi:hypothetical protein
MASDYYGTGQFQVAENLQGAMEYGDALDFQHAFG